MNRILLLLICFISYNHSIQSQENLSVEAILNQADSVYSKFQTIRYLTQSKKSFVNSSDTTILGGKGFLIKSNENPLGYKYHLENITHKYIAIYDGDKVTKIDHVKESYTHSEVRTRDWFQFHDSPFLAFYKDGYLRNLIKNSYIKSIELAADTIIADQPCYQIKVISEPSLNGSCDEQFYFYFQKDNYFCKGVRKYSDYGAAPYWLEKLILYADVNKEIDEDRFKYHKNIRTYYKNLNSNRPSERKE